MSRSICKGALNWAQILNGLTTKTIPFQIQLSGNSNVPAKVYGQEGTSAGFFIQSSTEYGLTGLINLFGIESLELTSAMAIANHVLGLTEDAAR